MTTEEYKTKIQELEDKHELDRQNIMRQFVTSNIRFKKGDIITDGYSIIIYKTTSIIIGIDGIPKPVYCGIELTKKLLPTKRGGINKLYNNITKIDK